VRKGVREQMNRWKADIQYKEPEAIINITENKGFIDSYFTFRASNISDNVAIALQDARRRLMISYEE